MTTTEVLVFLGIAAVLAVAGVVTAVHDERQAKRQLTEFRTDFRKRYLTAIFGSWTDEDELWLVEHRRIKAEHEKSRKTQPDD